MVNPKHFIGFDLGAESGRCVVGILNNNKIILDEIHRFETHNYKNDYHFHWNINKIFDEIIIGLKKAGDKYGDKFNSIGIDTWAVDYALIDSDDKLLNDPYHYRDDRTDNIPSKVFEEITKEELYSITGIHTLQFNTIFQLYSEYKDKSSNISKANKFLLIPDYLNSLLSNSKFAEYTVASTTGLTNQKLRDWNWELIERLKFDKNIFPKMIPPGNIIGTLKDDISKRTNINKAIPVVASAGHDTASAVVSAPSSKDNWAFLSSGTWSIMGVEVHQPVINELTMKYNFSNEGGFDNTIRLLKNIIGLWPIQECRRAWLQDNMNYSYAELTKSAKEFGYANGWLNLSDNRFLKAGEMPDKIKTFILQSGQKYSANTGGIIRIVLESLAFNYRITFREIEEITGQKISELNAVGGGIQNELLCQLTADALNIPVVAGPIEGTIIGNIGVQAIATDCVKNLKEWRSIVSNSTELKTYLPQDPDYFNKNEDKYLSICSN